MELKEHAERCKGSGQPGSIGSPPGDDERSGDGEREERRRLAGDGLVVVVDIEALAAEQIELRGLTPDGGLSIFGEGA